MSKQLAQEAMNAIDRALARVNAPWYVRAWHQWKGDEGWCVGHELQLVYSVVGVIVLFAVGVWLVWLGWMSR